MELRSYHHFLTEEYFGHSHAVGLSPGLESPHRGSRYFPQKAAPGVRRCAKRETLNLVWSGHSIEDRTSQQVAAVVLGQMAPRGGALAQVCLRGCWVTKLLARGL